MRAITVVLLFCFTTSLSWGQCIAPVDFNTWIQEGPPANGTWTPGGGGTNVFQSINGEPTFYVSPDTFANVSIQGSITVVASDDDFVGFVFGYQQPIGNSTNYDMYLFDWKQGAQNGSPEGFTINKVMGNIPPGSNNNYFWDHNSDPTFTVLATDYGAGKGWVAGFTHQVELVYTANQMKITVDGNLIFDIPGCYDPGRFGFYNYSQEGVTYADFAYQISANYDLITPDICASDTGYFEFVDTSCSGIPVNINSWQWDFGDGNTSTEVNPFHAYSASGTYSVQMIITDNAGCADSVTKNIIIMPGPGTNFSSTQVCLGDTTFFTDNTTLTNGVPIASWGWDFGDGGSSTAQSPNHIYPNFGSFNTTMYAINDSGCVDTISIATQIYENPVASFVSAFSCMNDTMFFTSTSTVSTDVISAWDWDFGDGSTSTSENPNHVYTVDGSYNVQLVVTTNSLCTDTVIQAVTVFPLPTADFSALNVCVTFPTVFVNSSTSPTTLIAWDWDFDDGNTSALENPSYTFSSDGTYDVELVVTSDNFCLDTFNFTVVVDPEPVASFSVQSVCFGINSDFIDLSSSATGYAWNFGDGSPIDNSTNPSYLYTDPLIYSYFVTLIVTSPDGCLDDTMISTNVHPIPVADFVTDTVCLNEVTVFTDVSTIANNEAIASYSWDFGDGVGSSTSQFPSYTYNSDGTFNVVLQVVSDSGCIDDTTIIIGVFALPIADYAALDTCPKDTTFFTDASSTDVISWAWSFDDPGSSTLASPTHIYNTSGTYDVQLAVVNNNGCVDTVNHNVTSYLEPIAGFTVDPDSTSQVTPFIEFEYSSLGASNYEWDMGNDSGFITSMDTGFTYIYSEEDTATYLVQQVAINSFGCRDTFERFVWIREDFTIFFPNTFTPNGDDINDTFLPKGIGLFSNVKKYNLYIFNRWGDIVFETSDVHEGWDGIANNGKSATQSTVFVWFVEMEVFGLGKHQAIGHVTLIR